MIAEKTFSVYLTNTEGNSYIDFGAPDSSIVGDYSSVVRIDLNSSLNVWSNWVTGLKWADSTDIAQKEVTFSSAQEADIDTG